LATHTVAFATRPRSSPSQLRDTRAHGGLTERVLAATAQMTQHHGSGMDWSSDIAAFEPPRRLVLEDDYAPSPDAQPRRPATEFLVEARSGGTCVVRAVTHGLGTGEDWDRAIESFSAGWTGALDDLRLYITHFAPGHAGSRTSEPAAPATK
jgi:uncharacterized protein YndB with AHSA1/START domain